MKLLITKDHKDDPVTLNTEQVQHYQSATDDSMTLVFFVGGTVLIVNEYYANFDELMRGVKK